RDRGARVGAREVPEKRGDHGVRVRRVAPEMNERIEARRPATEIGRVTEERSYPRRLADSESLEVPIEREDGKARLARARARIEERKEQRLVEPYVRIAVVPEQGRDHVERGAPAMAGVAPRHERVLVLGPALQQKERVHEKRRGLVVPVVKERKQGRVALARAPQAVVERKNVEGVARRAVAAVVRPPDVHPREIPLGVSVVVQERRDDFVFGL